VTTGVVRTMAAVAGGGLGEEHAGGWLSGFGRRYLLGRRLLPPPLALTISMSSTLVLSFTKTGMA